MTSKSQANNLTECVVTHPATCIVLKLIAIKSGTLIEKKKASTDLCIQQSTIESVCNRKKQNNKPSLNTLVKMSTTWCWLLTCINLIT